LLIVAPVGAYRARVRTGLDIVTANNAERERSKVRVILVENAAWAQLDPSYKEKFEGPLKEHILSTWKEQEFNIECETVMLPLENEEYLDGWLLHTISNFFKDNPKDSRVFVDLTSGPKEWQFAAINVSDFFEDLTLYYVKPVINTKPSDFAQEEVDDPGHPKVEIVRTGRSILRRWTEPTDESGRPNLQFLLFKTIFELAGEKVPHSTGDLAGELSEIPVPIEDVTFLKHYREQLPVQLRSKFRYDPHLKKSISKLLTSVDLFRLFEKKGHCVRMTPRGAMLALSLFPERTPKLEKLVGGPKKQVPVVVETKEKVPGEKVLWNDLLPLLFNKDFLLSLLVLRTAGRQDTSLSFTKIDEYMGLGKRQKLSDTLDHLVRCGLVEKKDRGYRLTGQLGLPFTGFVGKLVKAVDRDLMKKTWPKDLVQLVERLEEQEAKTKNPAALTKQMIEANVPSKRTAPGRPCL